MEDRKKNNLLLVSGAAVGLFLLNNILLGFVIPRLPGGSATGISTMFVVTWLSLRLKQVGVIPAVFLIYGLIGLASHLAVGDTAYVLAVLFLVVSSAFFDLLLKLQRYTPSAYIWAFPLFLAATKFSFQYLSFLLAHEWQFPDLQESFLSLVMGYAGIGGGFAAYHIHDARTRLCR